MMNKYGSGNMHRYTSDATQMQRKLLAEMNQSLRQLIEDAITVNGNEEQLREVNRQLSETAALVKELSTDERMLEYYNPKFGEVINDILPYSSISGVYNAVAPDLKFTRDGDKVIGKVNYGRAYEGPANCVHGGIVSGAYDQLMAIASLNCGKAGPTAYLHIEYKSGTPLNTDLEFQSWIDKEEGSKITVVAHCLHQGQVVSTARALFICRTPA